MSDILDLRESQINVAKASELYYNALREEKCANTSLATKKQQIKLDNMEALLSKNITAAVHKIKIEAETFTEELRLDTAKYDRKMCSTQLDSLKIKHYVLQKQFNLL